MTATHEGTPCRRCGGAERYASAHCRVCTLAANRRWRAANPEKIRKKNRRWQAANPEKVREKKRRWRKANLERANETIRRWRLANPERVRDANRRWLILNPEKARERVRRRRARKRAVPHRPLSPAALDFLPISPCVYCGREPGIYPDYLRSVADHVVPLALGGHDTPANVKPACPTCNSSKGAKAPEVWLLPRYLELLRQQVAAEEAA